MIVIVPDVLCDVCSRPANIYTPVYFLRAENHCSLCPFCKDQHVGSVELRDDKGARVAGSWHAGAHFLDHRQRAMFSEKNFCYIFHSEGERIVFLCHISAPHSLLPSSLETFTALSTCKVMLVPN